MQKPLPQEYPTYAGYALPLVEDDLLKQLTQRTAPMLAFYKGIDEAKAATAYAPDKWTIKEVLGHVIDTERIFAYRILSFLRGETQSLLGFDQDAYIAQGAFNDRSWESLVEEMALVRPSTIALIEHIPPTLTQRSGIAIGHSFTLRALVALLIGHELHHAKIIQERYL
ncbi:MAG: DinB family protein [Thermonemataceae bacterium]